MLLRTSSIMALTLGVVTVSATQGSATVVYDEWGDIISSGNGGGNPTNPVTPAPRGTVDSDALALIEGANGDKNITRAEVQLKLDQTATEARAAGNALAQEALQKTQQAQQARQLAENAAAAAIAAKNTAEAEKAQALADKMAAEAAKLEAEAAKEEAEAAGQAVVAKAIADENTLHGALRMPEGEADGFADEIQAVQSIAEIIGGQGTVLEAAQAVSQKMAGPNNTGLTDAVDSVLTNLTNAGVAGATVAQAAGNAVSQLNAVSTTFGTNAPTAADLQFINTALGVDPASTDARNKSLKALATFIQSSVLSGQNLFTVVNKIASDFGVPLGGNYSQFITQANAEMGSFASGDDVLLGISGSSFAPGSTNFAANSKSVNSALGNMNPTLIATLKEIANRVGGNGTIASRLLQAGQSINSAHTAATSLPASIKVVGDALWGADNRPLNQKVQAIDTLVGGGNDLYTDVNALVTQYGASTLTNGLNGLIGNVKAGAPNAKQAVLDVNNVLNGDPKEATSTVVTNINAYVAGVNGVQGKLGVYKAVDTSGATVLVNGLVEDNTAGPDYTTNVNQQINNINNVLGYAGDVAGRTRKVALALGNRDAGVSKSVETRINELAARIDGGLVPGGTVTTDGLFARLNTVSTAINATPTNMAADVNAVKNALGSSTSGSAASAGVTNADLLGVVTQLAAKVGGPGTDLVTKIGNLATSMGATAGFSLQQAQANIATAATKLGSSTVNYANIGSTLSAGLTATNTPINAADLALNALGTKGTNITVLSRINEAMGYASGTNSVTLNDAVKYAQNAVGFSSGALDVEIAQVWNYLTGDATFTTPSAGDNFLAKVKTLLTSAGGNGTQAASATNNLTAAITTGGIDLDLEPAAGYNPATQTQVAGVAANNAIAATTNVSAVIGVVRNAVGNTSNLLDLVNFALTDVGGTPVKHLRDRIADINTALGGASGNTTGRVAGIRTSLEGATAFTPGTGLIQLTGGNETNFVSNTNTDPLVAGTESAKFNAAFVSNAANSAVKSDLSSQMAFLKGALLRVAYKLSITGSSAQQDAFGAGTVPTTLQDTALTTAANDGLDTLVQYIYTNIQ